MGGTFAWSAAFTTKQWRQGILRKKTKDKIGQNAAKGIEHNDDDADDDDDGDDDCTNLHGNLHGSSNGNEEGEEEESWSIFRVTRLLEGLSSDDDYGPYWDNSSRCMPYLVPVGINSLPHDCIFSIICQKEEYFLSRRRANYYWENSSTCINVFRSSLPHDCHWTFLFKRKN